MRAPRWLRELLALWRIPRVTEAFVQGQTRAGIRLIHEEAMHLERLMGGDA